MVEWRAIKATKLTLHGELIREQKLSSNTFKIRKFQIDPDLVGPLKTRIKESRIQRRLDLQFQSDPDLGSHCRNNIVVGLPRCILLDAFQLSAPIKFEVELQH